MGHRSSYKRGAKIQRHRQTTAFLSWSFKVSIQLQPHDNSNTSILYVIPIPSYPYPTLQHDDIPYWSCPIPLEETHFFTLN